MGGPAAHTQSQSKKKKEKKPKPVVIQSNIHASKRVEEAETTHQRQNSRQKKQHQLTENEYAGKEVHNQ